MSVFAPQTNGDNKPLVKWAEMEIWADGPKTAANGASFFKLTFQMTPWIDPDNPPANPDEIKVKTWKTTTGKWSREYVEVFWPSAEAQVISGVIKDPDDLITPPGEMPRKWHVSYTTPLFLIPARPDDLQWAKDNNRFDSLQQNEIGQWMKKTYPIKLANVYASRDIWHADAAKNAQGQPKPEPQPDPEKDAALTALQQVFVKQWLTVNEAGVLTDVDMFTMEAQLQQQPFCRYFSLHSPEIKAMVARAIVAKTGRNENAIKGLLLNTNGFLDIESAEIKTALDEAAF